MSRQTQPIAYRIAAQPATRRPRMGAHTQRAAASGRPSPDALRAAEGLITLTRALAGMQKEAIVHEAGTDTRWRLLCDEGPWLNGTDLAPFPLGYFATGLASCFLADVCAEAAERGFPSGTLTAGLDVFFSMEGSILRGTMAAGVEAINLSISSNSTPGDEELHALAANALAQRSAVNRALSAHLPSRFRLVVNGEDLAWPGEAAADLADADDPQPLFAQLRPAEYPEAPADLVCKDSAAPAPDAGGAVGLQSDQKRTVHIAAQARTRSDGLQEIGARCVHPAGSRFVFLAEPDPGGIRAPSGLIYLSAGIAFCFMTQLGRYAQIRKLPLAGYRIVQKTVFSADRPSPVETAVFLDSVDSADNNLAMVHMGEQTCYVHTSLREPQNVTLTRPA